MQLGLAREDRVQARATLLPGVDYNNSFIYTEGNRTATGVFIANNGVHEYVSQGAVQQTVGVGQFADYRRAAAAQALARANAEIAARGLVVTVVQAYYGLEAAQAKVGSMQAANDEAQRFLDYEPQVGAGRRSGALRRDQGADPGQRSAARVAGCPARGPERTSESGGLAVPELLSGLHAGRRHWRGAPSAAYDRGAGAGAERTIPSCKPHLPRWM